MYVIVSSVFALALLKQQWHSVNKEMGKLILPVGSWMKAVPS